jgi:hypothetical protein
MNTPGTFYVIYRNDALDTVVAVGSRQQVKKQLHMSEGTFASMICRAKKEKRNRYTVVELEEQYED